jgi:hypothetical protein
MATTPRRIYRVENHLIRAASTAQAVRHYATFIDPIRVANSEDLIELTKAGVEVQDAGAEPEASGEAHE